MHIWFEEQMDNFQSLRFGHGVSDRALKESQIEMLQHIDFPFPKTRGERLAGHMKDLQDFKDSHGHCNVPQRKDGKYCAFGAWINRLRKDYKKPKNERTILTDTLEEQLTIMGFEFDKSAGGIEGKWDAKFQLLKEFKMEHGHCMVSRRHKELGRWVSDQRKKYKEKTLNPDKIRKLEAVEFVWSGVKTESK